MRQMKDELTFLTVLFTGMYPDSIFTSITTILDFSREPVYLQSKNTKK